MSLHKAFLASLLIAALTACGGGGNNSASASASAEASAAASGNGMAGGAGAMMSARTPAPMPSDLNCGAVQPVWVNTKTHKYHEPASPMYGKTKEGKYMCPSDAKAEGDTPAGKMGGHRHHPSGGGTM